MSQSVKEARRAPEEFPVLIPIRLHWGEMDAFAHLNNTVYLRYFESARIAYFERMGIIGAGAGSVGPILASTSCRFKAPLAYPDTVRVGARVSEVDTEGGRFVMQYAIFSDSDKLGRDAAAGDGVIVAYDYASKKRAPLPRSWLDAIAAIEQRGS